MESAGAHEILTKDLQAANLGLVFQRALDVPTSDRTVVGTGEVGVEERGRKELSRCLHPRSPSRVDEERHGESVLRVIDYKTGRNASPADWFRERLRDTQLPLYAQSLGPQVTATVIAAVGTDGIQFKGVWAHKEDFLAQPTRLPNERSWSGQLEIWREQLELLVTEYVTGDTRILLDDLDQATGSFAPLTRVYEQLALSRGWIDTWTAP